MVQFNAGGKVIAIRNHPEMAYKSGEVYTIYGTRISMCKCIPPLLDIGLRNDYRYWVCDICNETGRVEDDIFWAASVDFAPYGAESGEELSQTTYEDIMQEIQMLAL